MTVCTASAFFWTYGSDFSDIEKVGVAIVAASDRKLTDLGLGIGYEGSKWKGATFGNRQLALVAGDIAIHSEVVRRLNSELLLSPLSTTFDTAERAARIFRHYRMQEAARKYLSPINLDENSFLTQQRSMDPNLVIELTKQMQEYNIEVELLILGCDGEKEASMYRVDQFGVLTNHSDIGFVSIGSGGIHSSAHFMLLPYNHVVTYFSALYHTFKAKKRAEADPHVGTYTDMFLITKEGASPIDRKLISELEKLYEEDLEMARQRPGEAELRLSETAKSLMPQPTVAPEDIARIKELMLQYPQSTKAGL